MRSLPERTPKENASTVAWFCIVASLSVAIATVVNTCYIAYSIHVTILKWILEKQDGVIWTRLIWLRMGTSGGLLMKLRVLQNIWKFVSG
jgi:hypothetical protein